MMVTYKDAGVDVERGYEAVRRMKQHVATTFDENVLGGLGSFGGFYSIENAVAEKPVLVAGTDGVGTKLKLAFLMDRHDTVGIDCVAMCVNDVVCQGAKPLLFLDYIATGYLDPQKVERIVAGVAEGCRQAGCALIGGETAEMPDFYPAGEYDLAGFTVGLVDRDKSISGERVAEGDVLVGIASSGVHSNGYSLVRRLVLTEDRDINAPVEVFGGKSWGETLLTPTKIYVKSALAACGAADVHGIAHITGGGFIENIPRILPEGRSAYIDLGAWPVLPVFTELQRLGGLADRQMYNTFNMGIGMVFAAAPQEADALIASLTASGEAAYRIGVVGRTGADGERLVLR
ncbi:MAG: phosphoribosylformylglycinamidine cyclo-ligase [Clostridia bacterium]|nr:phosphoribosylformylglycinamidine cyclo-ligase [Clostridia bacterium]